MKYHAHTIATILMLTQMQFGYSEPILSSFSSDGTIVATNLTPGVTYTVQWSHSARGPWISDWSGLGNIASATNYYNFSVPLFYRIVQGASTNILSIYEHFSDANGLHNLVITNRTSALFIAPEEYYIPANYIATPTNEVYVVAPWPDTTYILVKSIQPSGLVSYVYNDIRANTVGKTAYSFVEFQYKDGATSVSHTSRNPTTAYIQSIYTNINFQSEVTNINIYLRGQSDDASGGYAWERNTRLSEVYRLSTISISTPINNAKFSSARLQMTAKREPNDNISWEITDGVASNHFDTLGTSVALTNGLESPTRVTVYIQPSTNVATPRGTYVSAIDILLTK